ncbi:MAG TPA: CPBP family intramembrane glutamic endopeptidase [Chitinophagaceae bacterium]
MFLKISLITIQSFLSNNFFSSLTGPIFTIVVTYIFLRVNKKSFADIGLNFERRTLKKFFTGFVFGFAVISLLTFFIGYISGFAIQQNDKGSVLYILFPVLPTIIVLAFMEEVAFRGYPLIVVKNSVGVAPALIVTSILFGLYHVVFGWGTTGFISTTIWGLLFATLAIYSNGISMPVGFHSAINLAQLTFGLTGDPSSLWKVVTINRSPSETFLKHEQIALIIAPLVLLSCYTMVMLRNKSSQQKYLP